MQYSFYTRQNMKRATEQKRLVISCLTLTSYDDSRENAEAEDANNTWDSARHHMEPEISKKSTLHITT